MLSELFDALLRVVYSQMLTTINVLAALIAALAAVGTLVLAVVRFLRHWREQRSAQVVLDQIKEMSCNLVIRNVGEAEARQVKVLVESGRIGGKRTGGMLGTTVESIAPGAPVVFSNLEQIGKGTTIKIEWEDDVGGGSSGPHPIRECESASHRIKNTDWPDLLGPDLPFS
jgi:hypothetical protein